MMDSSVTRRRVATVVLWVVALLYAYGALVHVLNIAGLSGFDWSRAPAKWQALDIVYLGLDLIVVVGFIGGRRAPRVALQMAYAAFYLAACSQIVLYTVLRSWITDVPAEFAVAPEQQAYLTGLVVIHVVTLALVTTALTVLRPRAGAQRPTTLPGAPPAD